MKVTRNGLVTSVPAAGDSPRRHGGRGAFAGAPRSTSRSSDAPEDEEDAAPRPPAFGAAQITAVTDHSTSFEWTDNMPADAEFRCLLRTLSVNANGQLINSFSNYPACTFGQREHFHTATVEGLAPARTYQFRIDARPPGGGGGPPIPVSLRANADCRPTRAVRPQPAAAGARRRSARRLRRAALDAETRRPAKSNAHPAANAPCTLRKRIPILPRTS